MMFVTKYKELEQNRSIVGHRQIKKVQESDWDAGHVHLGEGPGLDPVLVGGITYPACLRLTVDKRKKMDGWISNIDS